MGSSAIRIIGRLTNARAIATRCCSPPDSSSGIRSPLPSRPTSSSVSGTVSSICDLDLPITCSANATFSLTVLFGSRRKSWKTVPIWRRSRGTFHPASRLISLPATYTRPVGRPRLAQHQPQERRLAGPGRAHEEDELALLDVDGHLVEGGVALAGVGLGDLLEANHCVEGSRDPRRAPHPRPLPASRRRVAPCPVERTRLVDPLRLVARGRDQPLGSRAWCSPSRWPPSGPAAPTRPVPRPLRRRTRGLR